MDKDNIYSVALEQEKKLLAEISLLDAEYKKKREPLTRKLEAVLSVKSAFASPEQDAPRRRVVIEDFLEHPQETESTHKGRVLSAALALLASGAHMKTKLLLEQMEARGVTFAAADPAANLSVILSKDPRFVSDRRTGWSLAQKNPQDAATSAGSLPT